ncbi:DUF2254 domain-containing protein [Pyxidicoccus xibeiensis]|uniref:DUF2254 domain-containing protein n=1 Tax=Pyxidicoccus xibeiensis TaxID=2906759 RepID=UPI0020A836BC|nr:DUF2254 family protein [Pyxidicoccus xibeiensis]MCP3137521.1 DUF2254 domain-containing protein [Pyxidicoccus xibeiensis]
MHSLLGALVGAALGLLLVNPPAPVARVLSGMAWHSTAAEARSMLATVLGIALSSMSIVLSLSMLVVQNAAGQYSPRLLRLYVHSAGIRIIIPVFVATGVYCLVASQEFGFASEAARVPRPALGMAMLLLLLCGAALVFQVLHTLQLMRVEYLVRQVRQETLRVARSRDRLRQEDVAAAVPGRSGGAWPLRASADGFVVDVDAPALRAVASARGLAVHVGLAIGEPVVRGAEVGWVEPGRGGGAMSPEVCAEFLRAIHLGRWRSEDTDVALGVRQLVDVAIKALSPAINDPYTAVEAVDQLTFLLCGLGELRLGPRVLADASGRPCVFLRGPTLRDYLELATDQILRYGATEPAVVLRLLRLAGTVGQQAREVEDQQAARAALQRILAVAERALADSPQLASLRHHADVVERALGDRSLPPLPAIGF